MYKIYVLFSLLVTFGTASAATGQKMATVLPSVQGVSLESDGSLYWLHFAADADALWPRLKDFWAHEGIALKQSNPELGYMETKWIVQTQKNPLLAILLSDQAPDRRERFRLRLQRLPEHRGTRVFIYHSAYGILLKDDAVYTGYLPPNPQLEIEMLERLALYSRASTKVSTTSAVVGKPQQTSQQLERKVASYHVDNLQAKPLSQHQYGIEVPGSIALVRKKLIRTLDRMNINIISATDATNTLLVKLTDATKLNQNTDTTDWEIDEDSDLEAPVREVAITVADSIQYWLVLDKEKSSVIVNIRSQEDNTDKGKGLARFSQLLAKGLQAR